ncbi:transferase [Paramyrothecium foliicola]|nr:transferase [Paramyrothecium foliicola]
MSSPASTNGIFVDPPDASSFPAPTFTPEASCTRDIHYVVYSDLQCVAGTVEVACRYFHLGATTSASECMPSDWKPTQGLWQSPGVCPQGYSMACASTASRGVETTATCCPSGFECKFTSDWPWDATAPCYRAMDATIPFVYTSEMPGQDEAVFTTEGTNHELHAYGLEIRFQSSDLVDPRTITSDASTSEPTTTSESRATASNSEENTLTSTGALPQSSLTTPDSQGGLSTGAKAGIGAGVGAVALVLLGLLAWWLWRRRQRPEGQPFEQQGMMQANANANASELPDGEYPGQPAPAAGWPSGDRSQRLQPLELSKPKAVPLSLLDATTTNFAVTSAIWLFERPVHKFGSLFDLSEHFRQSLRIALNWYPHWCGVLKAVTSIDGTVNSEAKEFPPHARRFGRIYAHYGNADDPGVDFQVTDSSETIESLSPSARPVWNRHEKALETFAASVTIANPLHPNDSDKSNRRKPLLAIRITHLACGGIIIAAKSTHPLADITTLVRFMKDWTSASRALLTKESLPDLQRRFEPSQLDHLAAGDINDNRSDPQIVQRALSLPLHRYDWWQTSPGSPWPRGVPSVFDNADIEPMGKVMPWAEWDVSKPVSHYTIHLTKEQVEHLWAQANDSSSAQISRHDAVLAHIWSCMTRARRVKQDHEPVHCNLVYGVRPALQLDETYLGSPIIMINIELPSNLVLPTTPGDDSGNTSSLGPVAQKIRETLSEMGKAENLKAHLHSLAFEKSPQRIWQAFLGRRHIIVTTWARAGLYDIDFGLGSRIRFADGLIPDTDGVVLIKEAPASKAGSGTPGSWTENGVDVSVRIQKDDMERLLKDPLLLPSCH